MRPKTDGGQLTPHLLAALFAALALPAAALEAPKDYAGKWTLSGISEGDAACTLILTAKPVIGGWGVDAPKDCIDRFAAIEDVAAWTVSPGGVIAFIDPLRKVVLKFEPTAVGGYLAHPAGGEAIALDRARVDIALTERERMAGAWTLTTLGGAPTCRLKLTATTNGLSGGLRRAAPCQAPWAKAAFATWRRSGGKITLYDGGGRAVVILKGDSVQGFTGTVKGAFVGFVRQREDH